MEVKNLRESDGARAFEAFLSDQDRSVVLGHDSPLSCARTNACRFQKPHVKQTPTDDPQNGQANTANKMYAYMANFI